MTQHSVSTIATTIDDELTTLARLRVLHAQLTRIAHFRGDGLRRLSPFAVAALRLSC